MKCRSAVVLMNGEMVLAVALCEEEQRQVLMRSALERGMHTVWEENLAGPLRTEDQALAWLNEQCEAYALDRKNEVLRKIFFISRQENKTSLEVLNELIEMVDLDDEVAEAQRRGDINVVPLQPAVEERMVLELGDDCGVQQKVVFDERRPTSMGRGGQAAAKKAQGELQHQPIIDPYGLSNITFLGQELLPLPGHLEGILCDWGHCLKEAVSIRWDGTQWLPVCEECRTK